MPYIQNRDNILPEAMLPLHVPTSTIREDKVLTSLLAWVAEVLETPVEKIPRRYIRYLWKNTRDGLKGAYIDQLRITLEGYLRYSFEEEDLDAYPKGVGFLRDKYKAKLLQLLQEDMETFILRRYAEILQRCREQKGEIPNRTGHIGIVNMSEITKQLLREAGS